MKLEEISNPEFKNLINLAYMQGENNNQEAIDKLELEIKEYIYVQGAWIAIKMVFGKEIGII